MAKRNFKYVKNINSSSAKYKLFLYSGIKDYSNKSKYIDLICEEPENKVSATEQLNTIIEEALVKEFSPSIKNSPNFQLLVDAVAYKLKKNSLKA
ncbi:MAG: hypothetical protein PHX18_08280 [Candidatus Gastranaerophilales bacterium]|nr:hypothetical protein [Candidatus Gastranaerophilales bacterium]